MPKRIFWQLQIILLLLWHEMLRTKCNFTVNFNQNLGYYYKSKNLVYGVYPTSRIPSTSKVGSGLIAKVMQYSRSTTSIWLPQNSKECVEKHALLD